jgi:hypothetical protein
MTFRDNDIRVLRFFVTEIFSHLAKGFFLVKMLAKQTVFVSGQQRFVRNTEEISWCCHLYEDYNESIYRSQLIWSTQ